MPIKWLYAATLLAAVVTLGGTPGPAQTSQGTRQLEAALEAAKKSPRASGPAAEYLRQWVRTIESAEGGNRLRSVNGENDLALTVIIARDGSLRDANVFRSSGDDKLDQEVVRVVRAAAPFAPLPDQISGDLSITRAWRLLDRAAVSTNSANSSPQGTDADLTLVGNWPEKFHDSLRYRRIAGRKYPDGRKTAQETLATVEVSVLKRGPQATRLAWTYTHMTMNGKPLADLALQLSVSTDGGVTLDNIDALQRQVQQAVRGKGKAPDTGDLGGEELASFAQDKQLLANYFLRDADIFFYPIGTTLHRNKPTEIDAQIVGLDASTLRALDRWTMPTEGNIPARTLFVEWTQQLDRRDVERYYTELAKRLGIDVDPDKGFLNKRGLYLLDESTFWPHEVVESGKVKIQDHYEQFDSMEMRSSHLDPNWKH